MNDIILRLISLAHILLVVFIVGIPFTDSNYFLLLHAICVPFIVIHWVCDDSTCVLSLIETKVREKALGQSAEDIKDNCYTCALITPVYEFKKRYQKYSTIVYLATIALFSISFCRLVGRYKTGEIKGVVDLFRI